MTKYAIIFVGNIFLWSIFYKKVLSLFPTNPKYWLLLIDNHSHLMKDKGP